LKLIICLIISLSASSFASTKQEQQLNPDIKKVIDQLIPGALNKKGQTHLKSVGCNIQKEKWLMLMLTKESFTENIRFNKTCDFQGKVPVAADKFFPFNIKIQNLKNFKALNSLFKFSLAFEKEPVLKIWIKDAALIGKAQKYFNLSYSFIIDPLNAEKPIKKSLGGLLELKENKKIKKIVLK